MVADLHMRHFMWQLFRYSGTMIHVHAPDALQGTERGRGSQICDGY